MARNSSYQSVPFISNFEEISQRIVAENQNWLLAKKMNGVAEGLTAKDILEQMGFKILGEYDNLFFEVSPPEGWTKETLGYWTTVRDYDENERIVQFFKGTLYDRRAFLNITEE